MEHYRIKSDVGKHVIKGIYHIQNVNGVNGRLKQTQHSGGSEVVCKKSPFSSNILPKGDLLYLYYGFNTNLMHSS
ncbi:hypothetical protein GCM10010916_13600 [Paenibacillus abyssi]|uniref:Uncharacterized protein n=1 Tax=Paenibacillus abyssi TaxID=1340531 RepID=A0A917CV02_9BACL|nr:hypothetical protein GCM10010916_13600 [Paenibacillus abyssi]